MAYKMYKSGFLVNGNGWINQSNKYIEIMLFIDNQLDRYKRELEKDGQR